MSENFETDHLAARMEVKIRAGKELSRTYSPEDVLKLRGSVRVEHSLARLGAEKILAA